MRPKTSPVNESHDKNYQFPDNMDVAAKRIGQGWTLCGGEIDNFCLETYQLDNQVLR